MALRERIIHERKLKRVASSLSIPTNKEDEMVIDKMLKDRRARRRGGSPVKKLRFTKEDSDRLVRIEAMLEDVLSKLDLV